MFSNIQETFNFAVFGFDVFGEGFEAVICIFNCALSRCGRRDRTKYGQPRATLLRDSPTERSIQYNCFLYPVFSLKMSSFSVPKRWRTHRIPENRSHALKSIRDDLRTTVTYTSRALFGVNENWGKNCNPFDHYP
jgi:hypothetical protein